MDAFLKIRQASLVVPATIAGTVLAAWLVPVWGSVLPAGWNLMKPNTALGLILSAASLALVHAKPGFGRRAAGRACAALVLLLAFSALSGHLTGRGFGLETLLAADGASLVPGRMSIQTAALFVLLGTISLLGGTPKKSRRTPIDALSLVFILGILTLFAAWWFGAVRLTGQSSVLRISPHTLLCMAFLGLVVFLQGLEGGFLSVLGGVGIGSRIGRLVLPLMIVIPVVAIRGGAQLVAAGLLSVPYAAAITAALMAGASVPLVVLAARKINDLERALRDLSLTDELTRAHNRRGFNILGEHMLRSSRRDGVPLNVSYFDLDGLKQVNDTLGHDAGSRVIAEFADLLRSAFRESDVVARVGGDEFAVLHTGSSAGDAPLDRLAAGSSRRSDRGGRIRYSVGQAASDPSLEESFAGLVDRADAAMYAHKMLRKGNPRSSTGDAPVPDRIIPACDTHEHSSASRPFSQPELPSPTVPSPPSP